MYSTYNPPEGFIVCDPKSATHVADVGGVLKKLPCRYSRSLICWLKVKEEKMLTITIKGEVNSDMAFTGTASWLNVDDLETREYLDTPIEKIFCELVDKGSLTITLTRD